MAHMVQTHIRNDHTPVWRYKLVEAKSISTTSVVNKLKNAWKNVLCCAYCIGETQKVTHKMWYGIFESLMKEVWRIPVWMSRHTTAQLLGVEGPEQKKLFDAIVKPTCNAQLTLVLC